jgi:PAS domain-containing protein
VSQGATRAGPAASDSANGAAMAYHGRLMSQHDIEVILTQQLASYLALPIFIVDPAGNLIFYNEPAENVLGMRFDETGEMKASEWGTAFRPTDEAGAPVPVEQLPLVRALQELRPAQAQLWIVGMDGKRRGLEITAVPIIGIGGRVVGAAAIFWESKTS